MEITTKIEFRPAVRQAFVETGGDEIQSIQMLNRASSTTDLLPLLDTFTQTPRDDMSEQSLKLLTVSGDSFLDQETQTPRSVTHKKKKKKKKSDDPSYLEGDEVARPVTRARSRRRTGVSSVSDVNVSMTESSMCDSTSVSASDTSISQASYSLESARVVKKAQICQTSFSLPTESLYTTETSFSQQSDQSISKESILPNPMVSDNVSSLTNSTMHIYKSSLASVHDSASVPVSEDQNERYASSGNTQENRAEIGNSEEYYSYDRAGEKEKGTENITGEKERKAPQSEGTKQLSTLDSAQCDDDPFWDDTEKDTVEVSYGSSIVKPNKLEEKKDWSTELKSQSRYATPRTPDIITVVNTPRDETETFPDDTVHDIINDIINDTSVEETCRGNVDLPEVDEDPRGDTLFSNMDETKENYVGNFNEQKTQGSNVAYRKVTSDYCYNPEDRGMDGESYLESEPENEMYIKSSGQTGKPTNDDEDLDVSRGVIPPKRKVSDASSHCSEIRAVGDGCPIYRQEIFDRPPSRCSQVSSVRGSGKTSSITVPDETLNGNTSSLNETQDLLTEDELAKMIDDLKIVDEGPQEKPDLPKRSPSSCSRGSGDVPYSGQSSFLRGIEETSPEEENIPNEPEQSVEQSLPESRGGADAIESKGEEDAPEPTVESASDTSSCRGSGTLEVCTSGVLARGNEGDKIRTETNREPIVDNSVTQQEDMTKGDLLESKVQDISSFEDNLQCTSSPQGFDNGLSAPEGTQENDVIPETLKDERIDNDKIVKSCPGVEKQMSNTQDDDNHTSDNGHDKKLSNETTVLNETQETNQTQGCVLDHSYLSTTRGGFADEPEDATLGEDSTGDQPFDIYLANEGSADIAASTEDIIAKDSKATNGSDERRTEESQKESDSAREVCQNIQVMPTVSTEVTKRSSSEKSPRKPRTVSGRPGGHCPDIAKGSDKTESESLEENEDTNHILNESRGLADNVIKETPKLLEDKEILESPQDTTIVGEDNANTFVMNESRGLFEIEDFEQLKEEPTADKNEGSIDKTCDGSVAVANEKTNSDDLIHSETETNNFRTPNNQEADDLETPSQGMTQQETEISSKSRQSEDTATPEDANNVTADYSMERGETTDTPREETIVTAPRLQRSPSVCSRGSVSEECPPPGEPSERSPEENALATSVENTHANEQSGEHQLAAEMSVENTHSNEMTEEKQLSTASIGSLGQISTTNATSGEEILPVAETATGISEENPSAPGPFNENPEKNMPAIEPGNKDSEANATEPSNKCPEDNSSATEPSNKCPEDNPSATEPSNQGPEDNPSATEPSNKSPEDNPSATEPSNQDPGDNPSATEPSNKGREDISSATEPSNKGREDIPSATEPSNKGSEDNPSVTESSNNSSEDNPSVTEPSNKGSENNPSATKQASEGPGTNSIAYVQSTESSDEHPTHDDTAKVVGNTAKLEVEQPVKSHDKKNGKVDESEHRVKEGSMEESAGEDNGMVDKDTANISTGSFVAAEYPSQHGFLENDLKIKDETEKSIHDVKERPNVEKQDSCLSPMNFFAEEGNTDVQKDELLEQQKQVSENSPKDSAEEKNVKDSTPLGPVNFFTGDESEIFSPDQTFVQSSITGDSTMYLSAESTETTASSDSSKLESSTPENLQYVTLQPESTPELKSQEFELLTASKSDEDASKQTENNEHSHHADKSAVTESNGENISDKLPCDVEESEEFTRLPVAQERRMSVESRGSRCSEQEATPLSSQRADASFMNGNISMLPNEEVPQSEQHINGTPINDMPSQQDVIREEEKPLTYSTLSSVLVPVQQTEASTPVDEKIRSEPSPLESNPTEVDVYPSAGETTIVDIAVLPQAASARGSDGNAYHSFLDGKQSAGISNEVVSTGLEEEEMKDLSFEIGEAVDKTIQMIVSQEYSFMKKHDKNADKSCTERKREVNDHVSSSQEQSILLVSDSEDKSLIKTSPDVEDVKAPKGVLASSAAVITPERSSPEQKDQAATHPNDKDASVEMSLQVKDQDASDKTCTKLQDSPKETSSQAKDQDAPKDIYAQTKGQTPKEPSAHPKDGEVPQQPSAQPEAGDSPGEQSASSKEGDVSEEPFIHPKEGDVPEEARGGEEEDCEGLATLSKDFKGGESGTLNTHETKMTPGQTDIVENSEETKESDNGKVGGSKDESAGTNGNLMLAHKIILVSENVPPPFPKAKIIGKDVDGSQLILVSEKPQV